MERLFLISSGRGPRECEWVVGRLAGALRSEAKAAGGSATIVRESGEDTDPAKSLLLDWRGPDIFPNAGSICWIGTSPFRPTHKRRNWFVGVTPLTAADAGAVFDAKDVRIQTMRASGPGGQHVNKTESAVRARHLPTGVTVMARSARSQHANKRDAIVRLAARLLELEQRNRDREKAGRWQAHNSLERGNPLRVYEGKKFKLRKN